MSKAEEKTGEVFQLGILPEHTVRLSGEEKLAGESLPRLQCVITIKIKDRQNGGEFTRKVPYDCSDPDKVPSVLSGILDHTRIQADIKSFVKGRG